MSNNPLPRTAVEDVMRSSLTANSEDAMQEAIIVISRKHPELVWNFVKRNYDHYFKVNSFELCVLYKLYVSAVCTLWVIRVTNSISHGVSPI